MNSFLNNIKFPTIGEQNKEYLDEPIIVTDMEMAIAQMKSGFVIYFYKKYLKNSPSFKSFYCGTGTDC